MVSGNEKRLNLPIAIIAAVAILFCIAGRMWAPNNAKAQLHDSAVNDIVVVPVQIERDSFGIVLVDKVGQTMCLYELNSRGKRQNRLKLLAARSWKYDRLLQQYNTSRPSPKQVKEIIEDLAKLQQEQKTETQGPDEINISHTPEPNGNN